VRRLVWLLRKPLEPDRHHLQLVLPQGAPFEQLGAVLEVPDPVSARDDGRLCGERRWLHLHLRLRGPAVPVRQRSVQRSRGAADQSVQRGVPRGYVDPAKRLRVCQSQRVRWVRRLVRLLPDDREPYGVDVQPVLPPSAPLEQLGAVLEGGTEAPTRDIDGVFVLWRGLHLQ
jgi:hypothetical protein